MLTRGAERLRSSPYRLGTGTPALASGEARSTAPARHLQVDDTRRRDAGRALPLSPESPAGFGFAATLPGPERVRFASRWRVPCRTSGSSSRAVVPASARSAPRIVRAGDERRLTGYAALPFNLNPYLRTFGELYRGRTILLKAGSYDVVFDSPSASAGGAFSFRYWANDVSPPRASLRTRSVKGGALLRIAASDAGSGSTPPRSSSGSTTTSTRAASPRRGDRHHGLRAGRHTLRLQVSDYQESRNMENVAWILPNTRIPWRRASSSASCLMKVPALAASVMERCALT